LNLGYKYDKFSFNTVLTKFSEVKIQDFQWVDSPATTQAEADALFGSATDIYASKTIIDLSASYEFSNSLTFTVGGNNILNVYPTEQYDGWTDQGGFSDSVQMGSDGSYFFGRLTFRL
jgi:iron complex outermembrane receptor protein